MGKHSKQAKNEQIKHNSKKKTHMKVVSSNAKSQTYNHNNVTVSTDVASKSKLSDLQSKFARKLEGGRFRYINEQLYCNSSSDSFENFQNDPELFDAYHSGYREQVLQWPENPLDRIITWIRNYHQKKIIADMGCGEARLAESIPNTVYSFDLVSRKPIVTACDIKKTPLTDSSVDIVVFCLSLMGKNIGDFLFEANRILKANGILRIVEVRSRFESEENGIKKFIRGLKLAGFDVVNRGKDSNFNAMFFEVECVKSDRKPITDENFTVKACVYKKR